MQKKVRKKKIIITAKKYLEQIGYMDEIISQDLAQLENMKLQATATGSFDYSKDNVQTSLSGDSLCNTVANYVDFERKVQSEIEKYTEIKQKMIGEIRELRNINHVKVLHKIYVEYKSLKRVADEMGLSYSYTIEVHNSALTQFEKMHNDLKYYV